MPTAARRRPHAPMAAAVAGIGYDSVRPRRDHRHRACSRPLPGARRQTWFHRDGEFVLYHVDGIKGHRLSRTSSCPTMSRSSQSCPACAARVTSTANAANATRTRVAHDHKVRDPRLTRRVREFLMQQRYSYAFFFDEASSARSPRPGQRRVDFRLPGALRLARDCPSGTGWGTGDLQITLAIIGPRRAPSNC